MSNPKHYGVDFYDVGPHPDTGEMIVVYKCEDVEARKVILTGIALRSQASRICREQLELMALGLGAAGARAMDITRRPSA